MQPVRLARQVHGWLLLLPAAVARDQLKYAVAELSTHDNQRVTKALNDGLQAALTGAKSAEVAMQDAQAEAERLLKPYR